MEFEDLGKHCELCRQKDILPFQCNCCQKYFCLQHITREEHRCEKKDVNEHSVVVCPKCGQLIRLIPGVKPSILLEEHVQFVCNPAQKKVIKRCPVSGCKEKLTLVNTYKCPSCEKEYCMKHRYTDSHVCRKEVEVISWREKFLAALGIRQSRDNCLVC